jgi:hypothetical protein
MKLSAITTVAVAVSTWALASDMGAGRSPEMSSGVPKERPASSITAGPALQPEAEAVLGDTAGTRVKKYSSGGLVTLVAAPTGRTDEGVAVFSELPRSGEHGFASGSVVLIGDREFGLTLHDVAAEYAVALAARSDLASFLEAK